MVGSTLLWNLPPTWWDWPMGLLSIDLVQNTWSHIALVQSWWVLYAFENWILKDTWSTESFIDVQWDFYIGYRWDDSSEWFNGYIDEFRMSKSVARWTSSFSWNLPSVAIDYNSPSVSWVSVNWEISASWSAFVWKILTGTYSFIDSDSDWDSESNSVIQWYW